MHGLCGHGRIEEAFGLFERMEREGIEPDTITFNKLISGLRKQGRVKEGIKLLDKMRLKRCNPNPGTYQEVLYGLLGTKKFVKAKEFIGRMFSQSVSPSFESYKLMIHGLCKRNLLEDVDWQNSEILQHLIPAGPPPQQELSDPYPPNLNDGGEHEEDRENDPPHKFEAEQSQVRNQHREPPSSPPRNPQPQTGITFCVKEKTEKVTYFDLQIKDLKVKMEDVIQAIKGKSFAAIDDPLQRTNLPFSPAFMKYPLPSKFKMPSFESFNGTKNPLDHLETFQALMHLPAVPNEIMC
ncbi:pentatricopeptide repeat-containing protein At4g01400, mitochondrial-like [Cornus florida]|uniref:pentatricopeptide repeat-containing protein At4g01400, mitochondrial-like n=1 Tax=Cornus florida TaxID=4283 RepID=UPI0028A066E4|nr:pentatricopeptide repeat-containing protein At4g01400, mitochondrial-like [Cornus florida]